MAPLSRLMPLCGMLLFQAHAFCMPEQTPSAREIVAQSLQNFEKICSLSFKLERGSYKASENSESYSWLEMPPCYTFHYRSYNKERKYLFEWLVGFDGATGYKFSPSITQMEISKKGFHDFANALLSKNWTPLNAYDFLLTKGHKGSPLRLSDLKNQELIDAAALKASEIQGYENPYLLVQDAVCLEFKDCYDSKLDQAVILRVYFSKKHAFFPIAWEKADPQGNPLVAYFTKGDAVVVNPGNGKAFLPQKFLVRNLETCRKLKIEIKDMKPTEAFIKGIDDSYDFSSVGINTLEVTDFIPDPSMADSILDLDSDVVVKIPK